MRRKYAANKMIINKISSLKHSVNRGLKRAELTDLVQFPLLRKIRLHGNVKPFFMLLVQHLGVLET